MMTAKWTFPRALTIPAACLLTLPCLVIAPAQAQTVTSASSQLRRTVDPSERSAYGTVTMRRTDDKQGLQVKIKHLNLDSFALWFNANPTFTNGSFARALAPLNRTNSRQGIWSRTLVGTNGAPPEFVKLSLLDLNDLAGTSLDIANSSDNNLITGVTNIVGNTTNIVMGIPIPSPDVTNDILVALWAPLPALSTHPSALRYSGRNTLEPPAGTPPPSPGAMANVRVKFSGNDGRSIFDVNAHNLTQGQVYHVFISDSTNSLSVLIDAGTMTTHGKSARFLRDTKFGDPLPQQVRDASDLTGRIIQIRDDNAFFIHLEGVVP